MTNNEGRAPYLAKKAEKEALKQENTAQRDKIRAQKKSKKGFKLIAILAVVVVVVLFIANKGTDDFSNTTQAVANDHVLGDENTAKITLLEYSDFQCPACSVFHGIVKETLAEHPNDIAFVYRHFPLSFHENANLAALASEAASSQGMFWEMYDAIFESQKEWEELNSKDAKLYFEAFATDFELDIEKYRNDIKSPEAQQKIDDDIKSGTLLRVNATPTFFIDGEKITIETFDQFNQLIKDAIGARTIEDLSLETISTTTDETLEEDTISTTTTDE